MDTFTDFSMGASRTIQSLENGQTILVGPINAFTGITALWRGEGAAPAGTLTFTVDGDAGTGVNVMDLATGQRTVVSNMPLSFVHIAVDGLPENGAVTLYFR